MKNKLIDISRKTRETEPLIHCIIGAVSANLCANGILSVGARPVCAQHPAEVSEITAKSNALLVNFSSITRERVYSIKRSLSEAKKRNIPVVIDAVGIACSKFRNRLIRKLIAGYKVDVIKGNYSEIYALYSKKYTASGVDDCGEIDVDKMMSVARTLSKKYNTIILASGKTDVVCDKNSCYLIKNGTHKLGEITGTGCLLGAITATYFSAERSVYSAVLACVRLGIAGEFAQSKEDCFAVRLLDCLGETDSYDSAKIEEV